MSCPPDSLNGFANLSTIPTQSNLDSIAINNNPFTMNFAPRGTPLNIEGNTIIEDAANTIMYQGNQFTLYTTKICRPETAATYYDVYGTQKPSLASLMFTFINTSALSNSVETFRAGLTTKNKPASPTQVISIILILPIYVGNTPSANAPYLTQIKNQGPVKSTYPSLKVLFTNLKYIGYAGCFDLVLIPNNTNTYGCRTNIYNFIDGITLSQADWNSLTATMTLSPYTFIDVGIIQTYELGTPSLTNIKLSPKIDPAFSVADDKFKTKMNYYTVPIYPPPSGTVSTNLTPNQFQCYPFDELHNLQTDPNSGKQTVVNLGEAIKSQTTQNNTVGAMVSWDKLSIFIYVIIGSIVGLFIIGSFILWGTKMAERTRASPVATVAATIPAVAGTAVAGTIVSSTAIN